MTCNLRSADSMSIGWINVMEENSMGSCCVGDGVTDDAPALNISIMDATSSGAGVVYLPPPPAGYLLKSPLVINTPCTILGFAGSPTSSTPPVTLILNNLAINAIEISNVDGVVLRGFSITFTQPHALGGTGAAISVTNSSNILIDNIQLLGVANGILIDGSSDVVAKRCKYSPFAESPQGSVVGFKATNSSNQGGKRCRFLFCKVEETATNLAIGFYVSKGYTDVFLYACGVVHGYEGVHVSSESGGTPSGIRIAKFTSDHTITGLNLIDGLDVAVSASIFTSSTGTTSPIIVASSYSGGPVTFMGSHVGDNPAGVSIQGGTVVTFVGCIFSNCDGDVIVIGASSGSPVNTKVSIAGCAFQKDTHLQSPNSSIHLENTFSGTLVCHGIVGGGGGGANAVPWAVQVDDCPGVFAIEGCAFGQYLNDPAIEDNGTNGRRRISNVVGYNPLGQVPAPAVPPSKQLVQNSTGVDCLVYVFGGSVSNIRLTSEDKSTGRTGGAFRVSAGDEIAVVYTAAPQWIWFDE